MCKPLLKKSQTNKVCLKVHALPTASIKVISTAHQHHNYFKVDNVAELSIQPTFCQLIFIAMI